MYFSALHTAKNAGLISSDPLLNNYPDKLSRAVMKNVLSVIVVLA